MAAPRVIVVGAGPAGVRAAETLAAAGLRPVVIDEAPAAGGQIYRRQPAGFRRPAEALYGTEAGRATALHAAFDALAGRIDHRPGALAWSIAPNTLHILADGRAEALPFDALILATGATDRVIPLPGWTLPGVFTLGGAQIALKAQACAIGARVVFLGTGPLLPLVAAQYAKAGAGVAAVLDTSPFSATLRALPWLAARPDALLKGIGLLRALRAARVPLHRGVAPLAIEGDGAVQAVLARAADGSVLRIPCDAVALGYHLRAETQLADLAGCAFAFDGTARQYLPVTDADGRATVPGIYLAGDGARVLGADAAEIAGRLAALAVLADAGLPVDQAVRVALLRRQRGMERFRRGLARAFPFPAAQAAALDDATLLCRCEAVTVGELRRAAGPLDAPEMNRAKAFSRIGMGRCQGRMCGPAAAEVLAAARGQPVAAIGRLRGQGPVRPLPIGAEVAP